MDSRKKHRGQRLCASVGQSGGFDLNPNFLWWQRLFSFSVMAVKGVLGKMTEDLEDGNFGDHCSEEIVLRKDQESLTLQMDRLSDLNSKCLVLTNNAVL